MPVHSRSLPVRLLAVAALALVPLTVSGCSLIPRLDPARFADQPADAPLDDSIDESDDEPIDDPGSGDLTSLSFDEGLALDPSVYIEWGDGLIIDDAWTMTSPDDGNGNWGYTSADGSCEVAYWQGRIGDLDVSSLDDRAVSDAMLAAFTGADAATIAANSTDVELALSVPGAGGLDARWVQGTSRDGGSWIMATRAFTVPTLGLKLTITCDAAGDPLAVFDEVNGKTAVVVTP